MSKAAPKKKDGSSSRIPSAQGQASNKEMSLTSISEGPGEEQRGIFPIWPEWNEAEVNVEKWDGFRSSKDGKTGKSPPQLFFEDPEGRITLPESLQVHTWKRPLEFILSKSPVVVEDEDNFDLMSANKHLLHNELFRRIISEIYIVWKACNGNVMEKTSSSPEPWSHSGTPWEHIYSLCKVAKGHTPLYNPHGKYVVRLLWMGSWRRITVDDSFPFDKEDNLLLPATAVQSELWPMLLTKAIIKVANAEAHRGQGQELGDFTVVHALTGWLPELIQLQARYPEKVWDFLKEAVPKFQYDERCEETLSLSDAAAGRSSTLSEHKSDLLSANRSTDRTEAPVHPCVAQMVVCARYQPPHHTKTSLLGQMADASERLRWYGLSQLHSHTLLVSRTRDCPLIVPPTSPPIPRWKLVRPRKQKMPTDEPKKTPILKPDQFIEVSSPFLNRQATIPINPDLAHQSGLHSRRSCKSTLASFSELEEAEAQQPVDTGDEPPTGTLHMGSAEVTAEDEKKEENAGSAHVVPEPDNPAPAAETAGQAGGQSSKSPEVSHRAPLLQETWIHLDDFNQCFQTLLVFHKPDTYINHYQKSSLKLADERGTYFLFMDSLLPTEILVSFSALVHWGGTPDERKCSSFHPGLLVAKPFCWKSVKFPPPVLHLQTMSTKASLLSLPAGRHVLHFRVMAPLGYHLHLCSATPFVCGDEESIKAHLGKESLRFTEQAMEILTALHRVITVFSDEHKLPDAVKALELAYSPSQQQGACSRKEHSKVFNDAVFHMVTVALGRKLTTKEVFALQALVMDPSLGTDFQERTASPDSEVPQEWRNREVEEREAQAASILQASCKGQHVRAVLRGAKPGTKENASASESLRHIWSFVEPDTEKHAVCLLRYVFSNSEASAQLYPCFEDEQSRMLFTDYSVSLPDYVSNSWFLVFREVFFVSRDMLMAPKVYCSSLACILHVINNDTGEEVPRVFLEVEPHIYKLNQRGYTFVAEARFGDTPPTAETWKMRLFRSCDPPPKLSRDTPVSGFAIKEFRDYYIPNDKNIICRFSVKVSAEHMGTIQIQTSKRDVHIKLLVLDHEQEVASNTGKGHVIMTIFRFLPSDRPDASTGMLSPGARGGSQSDSAVGQAGVTVTAAPKGSSEEAMSGQLTTSVNQLASQTPSHKYIIQAEVLHDSWSLDENQMSFVQALRELEKQEMKVALESWCLDPHNGEVQTTKTTHHTKDKERDRLATKSGSRLDAQSLDLSKPHWTLRFVSEQSDAHSVEVSKDTERVDEIKAMKRAWEAAEPGRSIKAMQARLQFINKHRGKGTVDKGEVDGVGPDVPLSLPTKELIQPPQSGPTLSAIHMPMDLTSFFRKPTAEEQSRAKTEHIQSYRLIRDIILEHRCQEKQSRSALMRQQLEMYNRLQVLQEEQRQKVLEASAIYWSQLQEQELRRKEVETELIVPQLGKDLPLAPPPPMSAKRAGKKK